MDWPESGVAIIAAASATARRTRSARRRAAAAEAKLRVSAAPVVGLDTFIPNARAAVRRPFELEV
jgi:hypothetical protein